MRIGGYTIEGELGRGGSGIVLRACGTDGRLVAIKILRTGGSPRTRDRFDRERRLLASFGPEDGFVATVGTGELSGEPYVVMPLLAGGTLRQLLKRGPLPLERTLEIAEALARATGKAHARGVIHRDLKPENILFAEPDGAGPPLIADLGLAKHFATDVPGTSPSVALSRPGQLMGTAGYMPPEQAHDASGVGPPADVFALGAIYYECITGSPAFEGETLLEVLDKVSRTGASAVANIRPETPAWLAAIVARCLAHDPGQRYPDARALARALATRTTGATPTEQASRRHVVIAAVVCGLLVVLIALAVRGAFGS